MGTPEETLMPNDTHTVQIESWRVDITTDGQTRTQYFTTEGLGCQAVDQAYDTFCEELHRRAYIHSFLKEDDPHSGSWKDPKVYGKRIEYYLRQPDGNYRTVTNRFTVQKDVLYREIQNDLPKTEAPRSLVDLPDLALVYLKAYYKGSPCVVILNPTLNPEVRDFAVREFNLTVDPVYQTHTSVYIHPVPSLETLDERYTDLNQKFLTEVYKWDGSILSRH